MFIFSNHRANLSWHVFPHMHQKYHYKMQTERFFWMAFTIVWKLVVVSAHAAYWFYTANALKSWMSAAEVKGGFFFEGLVVLSLICGRGVLIPQEAEEMQRVVDFLSYIIIGQGKIHVCSTYTCVSGSAQCITEVWTVRKMLDRKT